MTVEIHLAAAADIDQSGEISGFSSMDGRRT
jgi:hypothetical protein